MSDSTEKPAPKLPVMPKARPIHIEQPVFLIPKVYLPIPGGEPLEVPAECVEWVKP